MRVITWNIQNGGAGEKWTPAYTGSPKNIPGILKRIEQESADILVLQEYHSQYRSQLWERGLKPMGYKYSVWQGNPDCDGRKRVLIASKLPFEDCGRPNLSDYLQSRWAEIFIPSKNIHILGIHAPDGNAFLEEVKKYAISHKGEKVIILGDFNVTTNDQRIEEAGRGKLPHSNEILKRYKWYETMIAEPGEVGYTDAVDKNTITYFPARTTVDHVLLSPPLKDKCKKAKVFSQSALELSDHAAIIVEIDAQEDPS